MISGSRQLYALSSGDFRMPGYVDVRWRLHARNAHNIPTVQWPDGTWCHPANTYMRELFEGGLSRRNRGGSLAVYAANLTHLLRYCWKHRTDPIDLTDNQFTDFIKALQKEKRLHVPAQQARDANSVIAIGRTCIGFLLSVGRHHGDDFFIGEKGRIRAVKKTFTTTVIGRNGGKKKKVINYWHHESFPTPDPKKKRLPISTEGIDALRAAIHSASTTTHQKIRRYTMLKLLEITGGRRSEVAAVTVESLLAALAMDDPMLEMVTVKKRGGESRTRFVPISRADAQFLAEYALIHRRSIMRRTLGLANDHGLLLVNDKTGTPIQPNTITQEIKLLARVAAIPERICPHLFRHRFITKLFVGLIERHNIESVDDFRRMLLDSKILKEIVAEFTDHSNLDSLDPYVHLAFEEVGKFRKTYNLVTATRVIDSFLGTLEQEMREVSSGESPLLAGERLLRFMRALRQDLERAKTDPESENDPCMQALSAAS